MSLMAERSALDLSRRGDAPAPGCRPPVVISFYAGAAYYHEAARLLTADCERLGLKHDIVEMEMPDGAPWSSICREKIRFYHKMATRHPEGILWVDVDCRLLKDPGGLVCGSHDFAAFLRNFNDFRDFDPALSARTFHPSVLHFPPTPKTRRFLDLMAELEAASDLDATDDYFLEEAWRRFPEPMAVLALSPDAIVTGDAPAPASAFLRFGSSGNVRHFASRVVQHEPRLRSISREKTLLRKYAGEAARKGRRGEAILFLDKARSLDPKDPDVVSTLARWRLRESGPAAAMRVITDAFGAECVEVEPLKVLIDAKMAAGALDDAAALIERLATADPEGSAGYAESRRYRVALERRARAARIPARRRPRLWWMESPYPGNFGDVLNPYLVERLSGVPPMHAPRGSGILAIGSVIKFARKGTVVWGSGTPRMTDKLAPDAVYRAVRGPLTRQLVLESGGPCPPVYGDPALLLPLVYTPKPGPRSPLGLILHHAHADGGLQIDPAVRVIDVRTVGDAGIEAFIDALAGCDAILSSSLHGLIVAHAYGVPTRCCTVSGATRQIEGDGVKFMDHYAALGMPAPMPLDLSALDRIGPELAAACDERPVRMPDLAALLDAAPFPVLPMVRARAGAAPSVARRTLLAASRLRARLAVRR